MKQRMYEDVDFLTGLVPARNYANVKSLDAARDYIASELGMLGLEVKLQKIPVGPYHNVIARYLPDRSRRLVVGAHYDVCGSQPGADDNASAVAGLLETARIICETQPDLPFGIDFVAFCLEEPPFFGGTGMGSYVHAESLHDAGAEVMGMINYEMIGYYSDERGSQRYPDHFLPDDPRDVGDFIMVLSTRRDERFFRSVVDGMRESGGIMVQEWLLANGDWMSRMSDNMNYQEFGYPAVMVDDTAFFRNGNYHSENDTIDTLDFSRMQAVVDGVVNAILKMN